MMPADQAKWIHLCDLDELPLNGARGFDLSGRGEDDVFIVRTTGLLRCYHNSCPHWPGASLPWKKDAYLDACGTSVVCSGHGARFELESGVCTIGPCEGLALTGVPLWLEDEVHIWVKLPIK